jgi:hypothetical protein
MPLYLSTEKVIFLNYIFQYASLAFNAGTGDPNGSQMKLLF